MNLTLKRGPYVILIAAAALFNNWILGLFLNHHLLFKAGAVSELSALNQPHELVFRSLDIVSGILFVVFAGITLRNMPRERSYRWLVFGTAALGIANAVDALQPLDCSETLSRTCIIPVQVSLHHLTIPSHGYSSIVIAVCYLLLPVSGWVYATRVQSKIFKLFSIAATTLATAYLIGSVVEYLITGSFSEKAWGPTQEVQMLLLGLWFIVLSRLLSAGE